MQRSLTASGYCRSCGTQRRWAFAGNATRTGFENSARPRAYYRTCQSCGLTVLTMERVEDAEGVCRATIDAWLRARPGTYRMPATGPAPVYRDRRIDLDDALGDLLNVVWKLYLGYRPGDNGSSFLGYAVPLLRVRLSSFIREATGDVTPRRSEPKVQAVSSGSDVLESLATPEERTAGDRPLAGGYIETIGRYLGDAGGHRLRYGPGLLAEGDSERARRPRVLRQPSGDAGPQRDPSST